MDLEHLNKSQVVLLTLLISFVTSMATGIVTVSLMEQGITPVTNTVNQVVERTKEIVVKVPEPQDPVVVTQTKEVIINQADLIASAVEKNKNVSLIIYRTSKSSNENSVINSDDATNNENLTETTSTNNGVNGNTDEAPQSKILSTSTIAINTNAPESEKATGDIANNSQMDNNGSNAASVILALEDTENVENNDEKYEFVSRAVAIDNNTIIADASSIADFNSEQYEYIATAPNQINIPLYLRKIENGIAVFDASVNESVISNGSQNPTIGQTVVVIAGIDKLKITTALISYIEEVDEKVQLIEIDKSVKTPGGILLNLNGEFIGMNVGQSVQKGDTWFMAANAIKKQIRNNNE